MFCESCDRRGSTIEAQIFTIWAYQNRTSGRVRIISLKKRLCTITAFYPTRWSVESHMKRRMCFSCMFFCIISSNDYNEILRARLLLTSCRRETPILQKSLPTRKLVYFCKRWNNPNHRYSNGQALFTHCIAAVVTTTNAYLQSVSIV